MALALFNTMGGTIAPVVVRDPALVTFYTCGLTVYDDGHIGNFRSFLAADVLRRWMESPWCVLHDPSGQARAGPRRVVQVMNVTDVGHMTDDAEGGEAGEDRMAVAGRRILEAKKSGKLPADAKVDASDPYQIARFYEDRFREDALRLGLKVVQDAQHDPTLMPRATQHVAGMIEVIQGLLANGSAYVVGEAGRRVVYFRVRSFAGYGALSGNTLEKLREGQGGRVDAANQAAKEHPADFLLWKEDPRHIMKWDSPWGPGYPGWHIECTAMSAGRLATERIARGLAEGEPIIDVHSGGEDNIFPHHECEIAQSCCAYTGKRGTFARQWFHPRFLLVNGEKMSKSKRNFFTVRDVVANGHEPAALRLELVRTHYRSNANFTEQGLRDGQRMLERWRRFEDAAKGGAPTSTPQDAQARAQFVQEFTRAMDDDLNVSAAIAALNTWVGRVEKPSSADAAALATADAVLGVLELPRPASTSRGLATYAGGLTPDPALEALLEQRRAARAAKDFAASDAIRAQISALGYAIKDGPGGVVEVRRAGG